MRGSLVEFLKRPFFLSPNYWRYGVQKQTLETIANGQKLQELKVQAMSNLEDWRRQSKAQSSQAVCVTNQDWGEATQEQTRRFGLIHAVLTNASATFVGGAFLNSGSALEENIWARTSCAEYVAKQLALGEKSQVEYDKWAEAFLYKREHSQLIAGQTLMNRAELQALRQATGNDRLESAYKTFLNTTPDVCFRGSEFLTRPGFDDGALTSRGVAPYPDLSFLDLRSKDLFPFLELRSAALDRSSSTMKVDSDEAEMKKRIGAQLDTLIVADVRYAVLGAFGCGCYGHAPEMVATLYREAIQDRAGWFRNIVFPIRPEGLSTRNFDIFHKVLHGLSLDKSPVVTSSLFSQSKRDESQEVTDRPGSKPCMP